VKVLFQVSLKDCGSEQQTKENLKCR